MTEQNRTMHDDIAQTDGSLSYIGLGVFFCCRFIVGRKSIDLHSGSVQFLENRLLESLQVILGDRIGFGDDRDDVHFAVQVLHRH